jgi:hypothetical protein
MTVVVPVHPNAATLISHATHGYRCARGADRADAHSGRYLPVR